MAEIATTFTVTPVVHSGVWWGGDWRSPLCMIEDSVMGQSIQIDIHICNVRSRNGFWSITGYRVLYVPYYPCKIPARQDV
jgi:hypothetical protein